MHLPTWARPPLTANPLLPSPIAAANGTNRLPPVWYTISSITNLFSFPHLWPTDWTRDKRKAVQTAINNYILDCKAYNGGAAGRGGDGKGGEATRGAGCQSRLA